MSMQQSFDEQLRRVSDITPEELEYHLREARRQRAQAFASVFGQLGRLMARPFRRGREAAASDPIEGRLATHSR